MSVFLYIICVIIYVYGGSMKKREIDFKDIISAKDIENGNIIVLAGRPAMGKTSTCCELAKVFSKKFNYLFFDLASNGFYIYLKHKIVAYSFMSSLVIIKKIEDEIAKNEVKLIFIDYWQLLNDKSEWFILKLREISIHHKVVFVISLQLGRKVENRKKHLPTRKDIKRVFNHYVKKLVVLFSPAKYSPVQTNNDLKFVEYHLN